MKMEIPISAPSNGTLTEILVQEGDPVEEGQDVAVMEN
jgi:biotin carboxyl carrier protein